MSLAKVLKINMYKNKKIVLTICARGGSKGYPGKNIKSIFRKPLLAYSIEQAKALDWVDRIVVSTDDPKIKKVAEKWGVEVPFLRPPELATDTVSKIPVFLHAIQEAEKHWNEKYDIWVDLDVTSPLRFSEDIEQAVRLLFTPETISVITAMESHHNPYYNMLEKDNKGYISLSKKHSQSVVRRQDAPKVYAMNGSIYVMWCDELVKRKTFFTEKTQLYVMPPERSFDIDNAVDFEIVKLYLKQRIKSCETI
ncbi:MAG: acylneuraminate cytidylyltransferase family protein [Candidatus Daviesbacteria bacterium]|nr:acylneuraminate cytidylyltransferase family protein [Candidatus Daviesbacteria bacterium]